MHNSMALAAVVNFPVSLLSVSHVSTRRCPYVHPNEE